MGIERNLLLDWYLGSQKLREIPTLLCCIILSSSGKSNAVLKRQQEGFMAPLPGRSLLKSRHTKYPSQTHLPRIYIICHLPLVFLSPTSPLPFYLPSLSRSPLFRLPLVCLCVGLLVTMAQDNIKLCDFSNTNNNDFLSTPIAPLTDAESCEINAESYHERSILWPS